jgi:amino acid transporter
MSGNFVVYLIGYIIAIVGVAYGLRAAGVGEQWIIAAVLIMIGLGIVYALSRSQRDTPSKGAGTPPGGTQVINQQAPPGGGSTTTRTTTYETQ